MVNQLFRVILPGHYIFRKHALQKHDITNMSSNLSELVDKKVNVRRPNIEVKINQIKKGQSDI